MKPSQGRVFMKPISIMILIHFAEPTPGLIQRIWVKSDVFFSIMTTWCAWNGSVQWACLLDRVGLWKMWVANLDQHYRDAIMGAMASQITSLTIVYSTVYSGADQRKHHSSVSLAFVREIHRWPVNFPHKGPVTREMFSFDDVIMTYFGLNQ